MMTPDANQISSEGVSEVDVYRKVIICKVKEGFETWQLTIILGALQPFCNPFLRH